MKRVLIIGADYHYFNDCVAHAFQTLGWDTYVESYSTPIHPYTLYAKLQYKFSRNKLCLKQNSRSKYDSYILRRFDLIKPDLVFILNGDNLSLNAMTYMHDCSKIVVWMYDSITRMPYVTENLKSADVVYCYEQQDISFLANYNIKAFFLSQAVDTSLYFPIDGIDKKYDIVFAGEIWSSERRKRLLKSVINHFPNKRICFVGRYKIIEKGFFAWLFREHRDIYTNTNASAKELNLLYNQARVVLNIHVEQQKNGANPKVYEILASGAHEICDRNPYIQEHFGDVIDLYNTEEDMISLLQRALQSPEIPYTKYVAAIKGNTFIDRIQEVLKNL